MTNDQRVRNFYDLKTWKLAHTLTLNIYEITKGFPKEETFGLISQIRRAAASVGANIAEGFERYHYKDKIKFYYQARASVGEVQNHLFLARDLGYIDERMAGNTNDHAVEVGKLINGLIKSLEKNL